MSKYKSNRQTVPPPLKAKQPKTPNPTKAQINAIVLPEIMQGTLGNLSFSFDTTAGSKSYDRELESYCDGLASVQITGSGVSLNMVCGNTILQYGLAQADALGRSNLDRTVYAFAVFIKSVAGFNNTIDAAMYHNPTFKADIEAVKAALLRFNTPGPLSIEDASTPPADRPSKPRF